MSYSGAGDPMRRSSSLLSGGFPTSMAYAGIGATAADRAKIERAEGGDGQSKFVCDICRKSFTLKRNLTRHVKLHDSSGNKFKCLWPGCMKVFARQSDREIHTKGHKDQRDYVCNHPVQSPGGTPRICGRKFFRQSDLNVHARRHLKQKQFQCEACAKQFIRRCDLAGHLKRCKAFGNHFANPSAQSINIKVETETSATGHAASRLDLQTNGRLGNLNTGTKKRQGHSVGLPFAISGAGSAGLYHKDGCDSAMDHYSMGPHGASNEDALSHSNKRLLPRDRVLDNGLESILRPETMLVPFTNMDPMMDSRQSHSVLEAIPWDSRLFHSHVAVNTGLPSDRDAGASVIDLSTLPNQGVPELSNFTGYDLQSIQNNEGKVDLQNFDSYDALFSRSITQRTANPVELVKSDHSFLSHGNAGGEDGTGSGHHSMHNNLN